MRTSIEIQGKTETVDLSKPLDISIPLRASESNVSAWYVDPPKFEPVRTEMFTGSVLEGGSVNFRNVYFNPHGNGTHTECVGHISREPYTINQCLTQFFFTAVVVTVAPIPLEQDTEYGQQGDLIITKAQLEAGLKGERPQAIIIRTLPNELAKHDWQYSNTNPAFMEPEAAIFLRDAGIDHLLIDLPSVDREEDGGALICHHIFFEYPDNPATHRTISELIYVPAHVQDGRYLLNLQIASFENDASPSKPILFEFAN